MAVTLRRRTNLTKKGVEPPATPTMTMTTTTLTFLSSLTLGTPINRCHPGALKYLTGFKKTKGGRKHLNLMPNSFVPLLTLKLIFGLLWSSVVTSRSRAISSCYILNINFFLNQFSQKLLINFWSRFVLFFTYLSKFWIFAACYWKLYGFLFKRIMLQ